MSELMEGPTSWRTARELEVGRAAWREMSESGLHLEIPAHLREGLRLYVCEKVRPGGFLCAVLGNDLNGAIARADSSMSMNCLRTLLQTLWMYFPAPSYGSADVVKKWLTQAGETNDE